MKYGIISDIHGNIQRLVRAIHILKPKTNNIISLGDLVETSENADEIVDILQEYDIQSVKGTHDNREFKKSKRSTRRYFRKLPHKIEENNLLFVHGNPLFALGLTNNPDGYITNQMQAMTILRYLSANRAFFGHTHKAKIFGSNGVEVDFDKKGMTFPLRENVKYLLNPGAVSLARDIPNLGSCAVYDSEKDTFEIIRFK